MFRRILQKELKVQKNIILKEQQTKYHHEFNKLNIKDTFDNRVGIMKKNKIIKENKNKNKNILFSKKENEIFEFLNQNMKQKKLLMKRGEEELEEERFKNEENILQFESVKRKRKRKMKKHKLRKRKKKERKQ